MDNLNLFPLLLSFQVAVASTITCVILGIPIAFLLSVKEGKFIDLIDSLTNLPIVLPPTVTGYYLLVALGRQSIIGRFLESNFDIMIVFTPTGAVIAASVVAIPYMIKSAKVAFLQINKDFINSGRLLGRSEVNIFFTIIVPLSWRGIIAGVSLSFVRALGDFGATLMISGSIPNKTLTMPVAIYNSLQSGDEKTTAMLVTIMTSLSVVVLFVVNRLEKRLNKG